MSRVPVKIIGRSDPFLYVPQVYRVNLGSLRFAPIRHPLFFSRVRNQKLCHRAQQYFFQSNKKQRNNFETVSCVLAPKEPRNNIFSKELYLVLQLKRKTKHL